MTAIHCGVISREIIFGLISQEISTYTGDINRASTLSSFSVRDGLYDRLTVEEYLHFNKRVYDSSDSVESIIECLQLTTYRKVRLHRLSRSLVRRTQYAAMLLQDRDLYVFEEPDQDVDQETRHLLRDSLQSLTSR